MAYDFDGKTFEHDLDGSRLSRQLDIVRVLMLDGQPRTLQEIATITGFPPASVSARLRDLRKPRFGSFIVERTRADKGLFMYRVFPPIVYEKIIPSTKVDNAVSGTALNQVKLIDVPVINDVPASMPEKKTTSRLDELFWK